MADATRCVAARVLTVVWLEGVDEGSLRTERAKFRSAVRGTSLIGDETFADLFEDVGRSVPPRIVATVIVLQRFEGASDREAVDRFAFDLLGSTPQGVDLDYPSVVHTVLPAAPTRSPIEGWRISVETERGRWRDEETYFLYVDDSRRRHREGIGRKTPTF